VSSSPTSSASGAHIGQGNGRLVLLTAERLRRLERRMAAVEEAQRGTNARLDQTIDVLTRLVDVVAAQNDRIDWHFSQLNDRIDRLAGRFDHLAKAIMTGRTADLRRPSTLERRMTALERRLH